MSSITKPNTDTDWPSAADYRNALPPGWQTYLRERGIELEDDTDDDGNPRIAVQIPRNDDLPLASSQDLLAFESILQVACSNGLDGCSLWAVLLWAVPQGGRA